MEDELYPAFEAAEVPILPINWHVAWAVSDKNEWFLHRNAERSLNLRQLYLWFHNAGPPFPLDCETNKESALAGLHPNLSLNGVSRHSELPGLVLASLTGLRNGPSQ